MHIVLNNIIKMIAIFCYKQKIKNKKEDKNTSR